MTDCMVCCLDGLAKFVFTIFERRPLPSSWAESIFLTFVVPVNLLIVFVSLVSDWLLFGFCLETFKNSANSTSDKKNNYNELASAFYISYLACTCAISIFFLFHFGVNFIILYLKKWNPPLTMWLEMLTFLLDNAALPVLVCLMFLLTPICVDFRFCQWQLLLFGMFKILAVCWSSMKLVYLGLCCCCCAAVCTTSWPLCKKVRKNKRGDNLMTNVLRWMPIDTESSTWSQAGKWCFLSVWTFPLMIVALIASVCLIVVISLNENFLYQCSSK